MLGNRKLGVYNLLLWDKQCDQEHQVILYSFQSFKRKNVSLLPSSAPWKCIHTMRCCELYLRAKLSVTTWLVFIVTYMNKPVKGRAMKYFFYYRLKNKLCPARGVLYQFCWDFIWKFKSQWQSVWDVNQIHLLTYIVFRIHVPWRTCLHYLFGHGLSVVPEDLMCWGLRWGRHGFLRNL